MRSYYLRFFASSLTLFFICTASSYAQNDPLSAAAGDRYVISAVAGHVNFVEGSVGVVRKVGKSGLLLKGDKLNVGDRVSTGPDGKAEILLNPGSFVRLGGLSAFEFETTSLDDLKLRVDSGTVIFEVYATDEFKVSIRTPKTDYVLIATGVYRIDIPQQGDARLQVWKGLAEVEGELVKSGRSATADAKGDALVAKFDRDEKDAFDIWSKDRGKELTRVSSRLRRGDLRSSLMGSWGRAWTIFGSFGLWIFDSNYGGYSFLPFGYGWNSPYGYGYNHCVYNYNLPPVVFTPPPSTAPSTPTVPVTVLGNTIAGDRRVLPPFIRMQQAMGGGGGGNGGSGGSSYDSSNSSPTYSSPTRIENSPVKMDSPPPSVNNSPTKQP